MTVILCFSDYPARLHSPGIDGWVYVAAIVYMAIVGTVGLLGNSMMIVVFALNRSVSNNYRNTATSE